MSESGSTGFSHLGDCGGDSDDGEGGEGDSDDNKQAAASCSATLADAYEPTVTPSTSLNTSIQMLLPTQTATRSPAWSSRSRSRLSAGSRIRAANIVALGLLVVILTGASTTSNLVV